MSVIVRLFSIALLSLSLIGCATLQDALRKPEVAVEQVKVTRLSLVDLDLELLLGVHNPNPIGMSLSGLHYRLEIDERPLIQGRSEQSLKLAGGEGSTLALPLSLSYADLGAGLDTILNRRVIAYSLSGDLNFGLFKVPYRHRGELRLPSMPQVRLDTLRVEQLTGTGAKLLLGLAVENANGFPIQLNGLDYQLSVAGQRLGHGGSIGSMAVPANGTGRSQLELNLDYHALTGLFATLLNAQHLPMAVEVGLRVPGRNGEQHLPLSWKGDVRILR